MCARRFLIAIFILTLLVVGGAFAIFQWGGSVLLKNASPTGHFERQAAGAAPDYAQASSWMARPDAATDLVQWTPEGARLPDPIARVDTQVFYVHPTTYLQRDRWNAPLQPPADTAARTRLFVQSQASAFGQLGDVWAPRYRQAAYGAFLLKNSDAQQALDVAYSDVAAAFDEFLRRIPAGSPIILAGHSQGALHLERLLKDKIAGQPIARRIVAAYVVGWPISASADLPALGLPACGSPAQTGCILSWMSFGEPANPDLIFHEWQKTKGLNGGDRRQQDVLCVNPISGVRNGAAPPADNPGTLAPTADLTSATLLTGKVGARCDQGLLKLDGDIPPLGPFVLPGNNYHVYDYALFWGAIRQDAGRRIAAWHR
jgi:hypothetical protein